jgi:hypothetical protein
VRRRALLAAGALAALGGCGDDSEPVRAGEAPGGESSLADVALLNDALTAERAAQPELPSSRGRAAALEGEIRRLKGTPRPLAPAGRPPDAQTAAGELVALYVDLLAKVAEPLLRRRVGRVLASAARAYAELRAEPAPEAFVAGSRPEDRDG